MVMLHGVDRIKSTCTAPWQEDLVCTCKLDSSKMVDRFYSTNGLLSQSPGGFPSSEQRKKINQLSRFLFPQLWQRELHKTKKRVFHNQRRRQICEMSCLFELIMYNSGVINKILSFNELDNNQDVDFKIQDSQNPNFKKCILSQKFQAIRKIKPTSLQKRRISTETITTIKEEKGKNKQRGGTSLKHLVWTCHLFLSFPKTGAQTRRKRVSLDLKSSTRPRGNGREKGREDIWVRGEERTYLDCYPHECHKDTFCK